MAGVTVGIALQAVVEYLLATGRSAYQFVASGVVQAAQVIGTPRGILVAAAIVFLLVASLSRRHRW